MFMAKKDKQNMAVTINHRKEGGGVKSKTFFIFELIFVTTGIYT
jgi:hypothetical protein